jgi:hypothetical protein
VYSLILVLLRACWSSTRGFGARSECFVGKGSFVFQLPTLTTLTLTNNPVNASALNTTQLDFLAQLDLFAIDGVTSTAACPSN